MESKNMIGGIVSLAVVVICVAAIMMPVLSDATQTYETFTNEGYIDFEYVDDTYEQTITWDYSTPTVLTVGTDEIAWPSPTYALNILTGDTFFVRWTTSGIEVYDKSANVSYAKYAATSSNSQTMTITISGGTITFDNGGSSTYSITYDNMYAASADGDYVMKKSTDEAYLGADSQVFAHGVVYSSSVGVQFCALMEGTPEDGFTRTEWPTLTTYTSSDLESDLTAVDGYVGLYTLSEFSYTITKASDTSVTGNVSFTQFIVPKEVTVELSQHLDSGEIALINAIPVLVIVSIVIAAVGLAITSRRD